MITLAVLTGIPASEWAAQGGRGIATGFEVWTEIQKVRTGGTRSNAEEAGSEEDGGRQKPIYSG